jgi:phage-related protein
MSIPVYYTEAPDEKLKIIDSNGNEYYLPKTFEVRADPSAKKSNLMETAFSHGARDVSDGMLQPRTIEVSGKIWANTDAAYNLAWDALAKELLKENFKLQDRGRQINILKVIGVNHAFPSLRDLPYGEVSLQLLAVDPFWYAITTKTKVFNITSSPYIFQFDVAGNSDTFPLIKILNGASNTDFKLEHTTDSERELRVQDAQALINTEIVVDCSVGSVTRDGTDIISKFSGLFLRLLGGRENRMKYIGAACTLTIQCREAYL